MNSFDINLISVSKCSKIEIHTTEKEPEEREAYFQSFKLFFTDAQSYV